MGSTEKEMGGGGEAVMQERAEEESYTHTHNTTQLVAATHFFQKRSWQYLALPLDGSHAFQNRTDLA